MQAPDFLSILTYTMATSSLMTANLGWQLILDPWPASQSILYPNFSGLVRTRLTGPLASDSS
jgi:hypothetical protein